MDEANALEKIRFKREKAEAALAKDMAKIQALVRENAYISQDQQVYRQRFEEMSEQIEKQKNTIAESYNNYGAKLCPELLTWQYTFPYHALESSH